MATLVNAVHDAVAQVCPITGVAIGNIADKATWRADFDPAATAQQKANAQTAINNFDIAAYNAGVASNATRLATFPADSNAADLINRLATANASQIDSWINSNVTTLAQARTVLATIIKVLAYELRT